jgi:hypothetical protein
MMGAIAWRRSYANVLDGGSALRHYRRRGVGKMDGAIGQREAPGGGGHSSACLNCRAVLAGDYCHRCGQPAHVHRSAGALWHDLAHSVFHFEGKFWRTLPMLVWHPGALTRRYVAGERAKFLSPVAVFLFSVFLMFAVLNTVGKTAFADRRAAAYDAPLAKADGDAAIAPVVDMDLSDAPGPLRWIDATWRRAKANPSLLSYKLSSNSYKYSWALIPISIPLVWLLFLHRRRYRTAYGLYDHAVFVTYSIAFMGLFALFYTLLKLAGMIGPPALLPFVIPPVHMYRQLRGAYELSRWSALWRTGMLVLFAVVAGLLFFMLLLVTGLLG